MNMNGRKDNCKCFVCGKGIYVRPGRIIKSKEKKFTCSIDCGKKVRSMMMKGEKNHQYGLKGKLNSSFKGTKKYNTYISFYMPGHPFNVGGYVLEHRYIVEKNFFLFDKKYFIEINGCYYLLPEIEVHHKDENKYNNSIDNLIPLTKSEHRKIHYKNYSIIRDNKGRVVNFLRNIRIKIYEGGRIPTKATKGSNGWDCYARVNETITLGKGDRCIVKLGFALALPKNYFADIRGRSGLSRDGIDISLGLIDSDYRGEISACVINNSKSNFEITNGLKICQLVISKSVTNVKVKIVNELPKTERGSNGFGSSGK